MSESSLVELSRSFSELARRGGVAPRPEDAQLLQSLTQDGQFQIEGGLREVPGEPESLHVTLNIRSTHLQSEQRERLGRLGEGAYRGFFEAASDGLPLTATARIVEWFGSDLREGYPEASDAFLAVATTYWTYKVLLRTAELESRLSVAYQLARKVDDLIAHLFFPYDGPLPPIDPDRRAMDQRRFLRRFAPRMDVDQFMIGNPIIIRDRKRHRKLDGSADGQ